MSVTVQSVPPDPTNLNEFFVPTILDFNLKEKKTTVNSEPDVIADDNVSGRQNGDGDEEVKEMSPKKKSKNKNSCRQHSSFLLQPFLKPVDPHIESNKENPVLRALFGGKSPPGLSPWTFFTKTSINNCHPFKKTELSHDLTTDDIPAEIPKSLMKKPSGTRKKSTKDDGITETGGRTKEVLREIQLNSDSLGTATATVSLTSANSKQSSKAQKNEGCLLNRRKRTNSQVAISISRPRLSYVNSQRLVQLRAIVDNAIKSHKIYSMTGSYNSVRNALKQRGWIEKIDSDVKGRRRVNKFEEIGLYDAAFQFVQKNQTVAAMKLAIQTNSGFAHNDQIRYSGQGEAEIMNRMLKNVTEDLCWLSRPFPYYCYKDFDKFDMINRLPRAYFSNKVGLCNSLQQIQWFYESGVCSTQFPRTYNTSIKDELQAFKDDFRITACIGLLKWFVESYKNGGEKAVRSNDGKVELNVIEFALRRCAEFVKTKQHEDIDVMESQTVWEYQWDNFISQYYRVVNEGQTLRDNKEGVSIKAIANNVQSMLNILKPYWPQYDIEGYQNYWIIKPGGRCCGAGIVIKNHLEHILVIVNPNSLKETRYVVQKYIERPLLIYNTKFDIRQWFLVTNVYPLTVWMYRESYLRFCSQPFTLKNTHESIHLCNNAVQKKYKNGKRDRGLPDENMWDCYTFQTYLKAIGHPDAWEKYIYPGMKESFVGALLASQDSMERKKNCFELYGADFMISEALTDGPWLIEINSNPAMDSSTSVTARMCPQVLEDIIKVVIDRRDNKSASTGAFEMVYRQNCPPIPPYLGMSLCIKGKKAYKSNGDNRSVCKKSKSKNSTESLVSTEFKDCQSVGNSSSKIAWEVSKENETFSSNESSQSSNREKPKQSSNKRLKVDWVRKNIEDVKSLNLPKDPDQGKSGMNKRSMTPAECKEETLMMLRHAKVKQFIRKIMKAKSEEKSEDDLVDQLHIDGVEAFKTDKNIRENSAKNLKRFLRFCQLKNRETSSTWKDLVDDIKGIGLHAESKSRCKNHPKLGRAFDQEEVKSSHRTRSNVVDIRRRLRRCAAGKPVGFSHGELRLRVFRRIKGDSKKRCRTLHKNQNFQRKHNFWQDANQDSDEADYNLETTHKLGLQGKSIKSKRENEEIHR